MEKRYWTGRQRAAMAMARAATDAEARLIHYDLAGRYGVLAAYGMPFMLPAAGPATEGERAALQLGPPLPVRDVGQPPRPREGRPGGPSVRGH